MIVVVCVHVMVLGCVSIMMCVVSSRHKASCKDLDVYRCMVCRHIVMHTDVWYVCEHLCTHTCTCCSHFDIKAQFDANRLFHLFSHCNHGPLSTSGLWTTSQLSKSRLWTSSRLASPVCRQSWGKWLPIGASAAT